MKFSLQFFAVLLFNLGTALAAAQITPMVTAAVSNEPSNMREDALPNAPGPQAPLISSSSSSSSPQTVPSPDQSTPLTTPNASQNPVAQPSPAAERPARAGQSAADQIKTEERQRMLGIVPEFNTVEAQDAVPLTKGQKLDLWWKSSIDPFTFAIAGVNAGIEQAEDSYPGYHQGAEGFVKRYAAAYADGVDGNFWGNAVLPILLRQDPRYFRLGHGTPKSRLLYAALSTVRTRGDNGHWQPNYSNITGNLIGGAISNLYYPASDRGVGLIFERGFTVTAEGALGSLAFEFYPDAISYLKRRHQQRLAAKTGVASAPVQAANQ